MFEEHARRTVQLRHNHTLGTIDHEGSVVCHEWDFTHVDFFFLDVLDRLVGTFFFEQNQTDLDTQRRRIGVTTHDALFHIEYRLT